MGTTDQDEMLTVQEVMALTHLSHATVLREIHRGNVKAKKFGNRGGYRIRREDFRAWMAADQKGQDKS